MSDLRYDDLMSRFEEECYHRARAEERARVAESRVRELEAMREHCPMCRERDAVYAKAVAWFESVEAGKKAVIDGLDNG